MEDQDIPGPVADAINALHDDLHEAIRKLDAIERHVAELHAELEEFRPVLRMFKPNGGASAVQQAGVFRGIRKAARSGGS